MITRLMLGFVAAAFMLGVVSTAPAIAGERQIKVAIHVDENDKFKMNMALNNAANVYKYYKAKGESVEVRIVAYGPGLHMLRKDTSPVKDRIAKMSLEQEGLSFAACGNTHRKMSQKSKKKVAILDEAKMVPAGVVELMELQMKGWTYIRP
jgi:intracellular sulfur oxidation DsrE/DsrF family protein